MKVEVPFSIFVGSMFDYLSAELMGRADCWMELQKAYDAEDHWQIICLKVKKTDQKGWLIEIQ